MMMIVMMMEMLATAIASVVLVIAAADECDGNTPRAARRCSMQPHVRRCAGSTGCAPGAAQINRGRWPNTSARTEHMCLPAELPLGAPVRNASRPHGPLILLMLLPLLVPTSSSLASSDASPTFQSDASPDESSSMPEKSRQHTFASPSMPSPCAL